MEHKNTTGSSEYKDSDVTFNCYLEQKSDDHIGTIYEDYLFNFNGAQMYIYKKVILKYENLTDEKFKNYIKKLNSVRCVFDTDNICTKNDIDLGNSSLGWDTKIVRSGNTMTLTAHSVSGVGQNELSLDEILSLKSNLIKQGFICK